jgi:hypothetical protein
MYLSLRRGNGEKVPQVTLPLERFFMEQERFLPARNNDPHRDCFVASLLAMTYGLAKR